MGLRVGERIRVRFGSKGSQSAIIQGFTSTGRVKVIKRVALTGREHAKNIPVQDIIDNTRLRG